MTAGKKVPNGILRRATGQSTKSIGPLSNYQNYQRENSSIERVEVNPFHVGDPSFDVNPP
jgi:hypothetical protein